MMTHIPTLGARLRAARKKRFPRDDLAAFAIRIGVSRSTLQKMEQGDLSVTMSRYYQAATALGVTEGFDSLFHIQDSLFDD